MTREEARQAAEVMIAFAEGKRIEYIYKKSRQDQDWEPCDGKPIWDWFNFQYRVAPEPWTGKIWVHPDGGERHGSFFKLCQGEAIKEGWRLITVKEVANE